jgi:deferrochelatase/peroxidase EfeB
VHPYLHDIGQVDLFCLVCSNRAVTASAAIAAMLAAVHAYFKMPATLAV